MRRWTFGTAVLAAVAATLAGTGVAGAGGTAPMKSALLGGGMIGARFTSGPQFKLGWINLSVASDGRSFSVYGDWNASCAGFGSPARASFVAKDVRARADGSFVAVGDVNSNNTLGKFAVHGTFLSPTSATGGGDSEFTFTSSAGKRYQCRTGEVSWQARADGNYVSAAGAPAPKAGIGYYGNTAGTGGRLPFMLRMAADGKSIEQAAGLIDALCTKNTKLYLHPDPIAARVRISTSGTFASFPRYFDNFLGGPGQVASVASRFVGRFGRSSVAGTWEVVVTLTNDKTSKVEDTCTSGVRRFKADL